jgi:hypothetical protein
MRQLQSIHSSDVPTGSNKAAVSDAVRPALELPSRARGSQRPPAQRTPLGPWRLGRGPP